jgi:DNA-binding transcriptional LysR family regulator
VFALNLFHLRYFVQLAHTRHYTQAARELCITQPSLSHAIAQLELELGVPLFEKQGRNTELTRFGEEFLASVEDSLSILDASVESLQRSARGEGLIRLGLLRILGVELIPKLAAAFLADNPGKDIRFTFHTGVTQHLLDGLQSRRFDLIFCSRPPAELGLTAIPVGNQDLVLIVPRNHPLANRHTIDLRESLIYPYIYFSTGSGLRYVVDRLFDQIGEKPHIAYETEEDQVVAGLVAQGFGIAVVPYMDLLLQLDVKILQISHPTWERNFYMVSDDRTFLSPVVRQFRQFVLDGSSL